MEMRTFPLKCLEGIQSPEGMHPAVRSILIWRGASISFCLIWKLHLHRYGM